MSSADYRVTLLLMARDQLSRSIASAKKAVKDFADTAQRESKKVQSTWSKMAGGLNDVLKITLGVGIAELAAQAARSLIGFVQDSIRAFADLEYESRRLAALSREAGQDVGMLAQIFSTVASAASSEYAVSARDAIHALESLVKAGLPARDAMQALGSAIQMAKIEGVDYATASNNLVQVMAQFGLNGAEAARVVDTLVNASRLGIGTANDFAQGLGNCGASARALGLGLSEATSWLVVLERRFGSAQEAGTHLNRFFLELYEIAEKLGVPIRDANGALRDTNSIILDVIAQAKSLGGDFEMLQSRLTGVDMRATKALFTFTQMTENIEELRSEIERAGSAEETFSEMMDTTIGKFEQMSAQVEKSQRRIGDAFSNIVTTIGSYVLPAVQAAFDAWSGIIATAVGDAKSQLESAIDSQLMLGKITKQQAADWIVAWVEMGKITKKEALDIAGRVLDLETITNSSLMSIIDEAMATGQEIPEALQPVAQSLAQVQEQAKESGDAFVKVAQKFKVSAERALELAKEMFGLDLVYDEHADLIKTLQTEYGLTEEQAREYVQRLQEEAEKAKQAEEAEKAHQEAVQQARETLQSSISALRNYGGVFGPMADNIRNARDAIKELTEQGERVPTQLSGFLNFMEELNERFADLERQAKAVAAAQQVAAVGTSYYATVQSIQEALMADEIQLAEQQVAAIEERLEALRQSKTATEEEIQATEEQLRVAKENLENLKQSTQLTAQQALSQKRLAAIQQTLGMISQVVSLQQTAMQLAMMGATGASEALMGASISLADALADGNITQKEMVEILKQLGVTFNEQGKPVINLKDIMEDFKQTVLENKEKIEDFRSTLASLDGMTVHTYHYHHEITVKETEGAKRGAYTGGSEEFGAVPGAQHGAWETKEGLYYLHKKEMVLPERLAEYVRSQGFGNRIVNVSINVNASGISNPDELAERISRSFLRNIRGVM